MRKHDCGIAVKEIKDSIMNSLQVDPQFVNAITQQICLGSSQFVSHGRQALDAIKTFNCGLGRNLLHPMLQRHAAVCFAIEHEPDWRHRWILANLRTKGKNYYSSSVGGGGGVAPLPFLPLSLMPSSSSNLAGASSVFLHFGEPLHPRNRARRPVRMIIGL